MTVAIRYVDGPRLARTPFAAATDRGAAGREENNRIKLLPGATGATSTTFCLTRCTVAADALRAPGDASPGARARTAERRTAPKATPA